MAERISSLLRRSVEHLADEVPDSYRSCSTRSDRWWSSSTSTASSSHCAGGRRLEVSDGAAPTAGARITTSRATVLDVLDAGSGSSEAVETGTVSTCDGSLDDILRAHDTLLAYVHAAVRAPSQPGLLSALRAERHERRHHRPRRPASGAPPWRCSVPASPASPPLTNSRSAASTSRCTSPPDERTGGRRAAGDLPAGQARRPRRLAVLDGGHPRREPARSCVPFPGRRGRHGTPGEPSRASMAFASSRRTTCTSGTCSSASRSTSRRRARRRRVRWKPTSRTVMDNVRRVVTQGTTVDGKPSLVFPREAPRSPAEFLSIARPTRRDWDSPRRCADLREPAAAVPRHESAAPRQPNCRTCRPTTSSSGDDADGSPPVLLLAAVRRAPARNAQGPGRVRHALGRRPHQSHHLSAAAAPDGPPRQQGRRRAQRSHHRVVVRPLVPPPRRARCPLRPRRGATASIRPPSTRTAAPSPTPGAGRRWPTELG